MKKLPLSKLILSGLILFFTAYKKEAGIFEFSTEGEKLNYAEVENN